MRDDIKTRKDIEALVNNFYDHVREDELLGPFFNEQIMDWPSHLNTMYQYWENTILLNDDTYTRSPFPKHTTMPLTNQHVDRWLSILHYTITDLFEGDKADETKLKAIKMTESVPV